MLCAAEANAPDVVVRWGDCQPEPQDNGGRVWRRAPQEVRRTVALPKSTKKPQRETLLGKHGLDLVLSVRPIQDGSGRRVVSLFLVNERAPAPDADRDKAFVFQVELDVQSAVPFVSRSDLRGLPSDA